MERRNTVQKEIVLDAVQSMKSHVSAEQVHEYISNTHPSISKGTVYRNLNILAEEGKIRKIELPNGSDCFDFTLADHYHVRCVKCKKVMDVDMDYMPDLLGCIHDSHGIEFLEYDIVFKGICSECKKNEK